MPILHHIDAVGVGYSGQAVCDHQHGFALGKPGKGCLHLSFIVRVDPDNEAKVQAAFARLAKGKTVLMIAHRLSTVANADCIYVVQDGQIAESGTKDELCAQNGLFARMWQEYQLSVQWKVAKEG